VTTVPPYDSSCGTGYTVSPNAGTFQAWIRDDESTPVSLTSGGDLDMSEGDARDTATVGVRLGHRLYEGETDGGRADQSGNNHRRQATE